MKTHICIPVGMCEYACANKKLQAFAAYVYLHFFSDGIISLRNAYSVFDNFTGLFSNPSKKKVLRELSEMGWIGIDKKKRRIHIRSFRHICNRIGYSQIRVVPFRQKDLNHAKDFVYGVVLNIKLRQQQYAIKFQSGRAPVATKSEATLQGSYPGLGKFGLANLFKCSPTSALRIKSRCLLHGYISVHKKAKKITSVDKADYKMAAYITDMYPEKSFLLRFRKNYQTGRIDVYEQLMDEIVPLMIIKKRGRKRFEGILGRNSEVKAIGIR